MRESSKNCTRRDIWKTFHVLKVLGASGLASRFSLVEDNYRQVIHIMEDSFKKELLRYNFAVDRIMPNSARQSWEWYLTNLFLYCQCKSSYVSMAAFELAQLCAQFDYQPVEVFHNDWLCMSKKGMLLGELGPEEYYSHGIYASHLWVENVAARRIFFIYQLLALLDSKGLDLSECRILDVGTGMAGSLRLLDGARGRIGIDISQQMVSWCNATRVENEWYEVMDCTTIGYEDESFDLILCFDLLEHTCEPRKALLEIRRVVRDYGIVSIVYPFGSYDWDSHISLVEKPIFDNLLESAGYTVIGEVQAPGESFPNSVCYLLSTRAGSGINNRS